jgi:hypothetical protein
VLFEQFRDTAFVNGADVPPEERDRDGFDGVGFDLTEGIDHVVFVERIDDITFRIDTFVDTES